MPYYSPILPLVFVDEAPRALIAKTNKQPITRAGGDTFKSLMLGSDGRVGARGLKPPLLSHATSFAN